jgi:hypothetical protein
MRQVILICAVLLASVTALTAGFILSPSHAQPLLPSLVLYDGFAGPFINPEKWYGTVGIESPSENYPAPQGANETFRGIVLGRLIMSQRVHGNPVEAGGNFQSTRLNLRNPAPIAAFQTTVRIDLMETRTCAANPAGVVDVRAQLIGRFFNAGTPELENDTDDVQAGIMIRRNSATADWTLPANTLRVLGFVRRCTNGTCSTTEGLPNVDLGTVRVGIPTTLRVRWDQPNRRFLLRRDTNPEIQQTYPWDDANPPSRPGKSLRAQGEAPNCVVGATVSFLSASFDNVFVSP